MYTITGGRRLYKVENGKFKRISRDEVFTNQSISVLIRPTKKGKYSKIIYIEKELVFKQGSGEYKLINSRPASEVIRLVLLLLAVSAMLIAYLLTVIDESTSINVSFDLLMVVGGLWVLLTIVAVIYNLYFKSNYEEYARA